MTRRFFPARTPQRIPAQSVSLGVTLTPLVEQIEIVPAPDPGESPSLDPVASWTGFEGFPYNTAYNGSDTSAPAVDWSVSVQNSPISEIAVEIGESSSPVATAVMFNPPVGETVTWSAEWITTDLGYDPQVVPVSGQMASLFLPTFGWTGSVSIRLIATVSGVEYPLVITGYPAVVGEDPGPGPIGMG